MKTASVGWFEIPATNMDRATLFYETVFETSLQRSNLGGLEMAWFGRGEGTMGASGALVLQAEFYKPSTDGVLVYFSSADVSNELARIEDAGGKILMPKKLIAEDIGYMALFTDSEGNRIALHSRK